MAVTNTMLSRLRQCFIDNIAQARFRVNTTQSTSYRKADLVEKRITSNGNVKVSFYINVAGGGTVKECQLLDSLNNTLISKAEDIVIPANANAIYYFFAFNIFEQT